MQIDKLIVNDYVHFTHKHIFLHLSAHANNSAYTNKLSLVADQPQDYPIQIAATS